METVLKVEGMMCAHCKGRVEKACKAQKGVREAVADLEKKQVTIVGDAALEDLKKAIEDAGFRVTD